MFLIPPIASVVLLVILWSTDQLPRPRVVGLCVLVGVLAQWFTPMYSAPWVTALLVNVGLAIYLTMRLKLSW
jgi:hypothetical protein